MHLFIYYYLLFIVFIVQVRYRVDMFHKIIYKQSLTCPALRPGPGELTRKSLEKIAARRSTVKAGM